MALPTDGSTKAVQATSSSRGTTRRTKAEAYGLRSFSGFWSILP